MEFYTKWALFQGRTEIDQLELIFKLCGTPTEETWPGAKDLPWYGLLKFPPCERILVSEFKSPTYGLAEDFVDLIDQLLQLNPEKRPTAQIALHHDFFANDPPPCIPQEYVSSNRFFINVVISPPCRLPAIEGDWHEYEGKLRRKNRNQSSAVTATMAVPPPIPATATTDPLSSSQTQARVPVKPKEHRGRSTDEDLGGTGHLQHNEHSSSSYAGRGRDRDRESFGGGKVFTDPTHVGT